MNRQESSFQFISLSILLSVALISFISIMMSLQHRFIKDESELYLPVIPTRYVVDDSFLTSVKDSIYYPFHAATAIINHLESFLSFQLQYKGIMKSKVSAELSELLFNNTIIEDCMNESNSKTCNRELQASTVVNYFKNLPNLNLSIASSKECQNMVDCSNKNHLNFRLKEPTFARSVDDIKKLLLKKKRPLLLSIPEFFADYYVPCTDKRVKESKECKNKDTYCPYNTDQNCGVISTSTYLEGGSFFVPAPPAYARTGNSMTFNLIGFNNDLITSGYPHQFKSLQLSKGGFIVKSLNGSGYGHTLNYLRGRISLEEDRQLCGVYSDINTWKPCNQHICTEENYLRARKKPPYVSDYYYAIVSETKGQNLSISLEDEYGLTETRLYLIDKKSFAVKTKFMETTQPYWRLSDYLMPVITHELNNSCSYWSIPYELVEKGISMEDASVATTLALDLPAIFDSLPK
ncbi:hypothetical protein TVAG_051580 [Trichomonas vaginalis G3]|uniref:Uncharacterized protein n=1 Tax=Trichomonas vaginalis (strain ATCC PRA-98 / G3) TaxID=412133 RepID=A2EZ93_TRIV3|nr:papain family cysteine protease domain containing protein family [Trichomonas vaginalis G3]EAY02026.1 hypothetical protein TVAG_051580 [Trichomonas vaginalis G3]KAI5496979.1 papain family cysteine protease domain containing protein family [Trichomonas vaginalis G3]|eukprot:XP_001330486.1 hypothetical protein [Trichomonas vaginalis G3]